MSTTTMTLAEWEDKLEERLEYLAKIKGKKTPLEWRSPPRRNWSGIRNKYITTDLIRHYAYSIGDFNPLWRDPNYAKDTRWEGIIAPPTFEDCIADPHAIKEQLAISGINQFDAGASREYFAVIRPGDVIASGIDTYLGITEKTKPDKMYRLFLEQGERTLFNQKGEKVVSITAGGILTGIPPGHEEEYQQQVAGGITRPHYSQEQLDALHDHYEEELAGKLRRGTETRYWEGVNEGEEIQPIIKGPLDDTDLRSYMGTLGAGWAFASKWLLTKQELRIYIDPETGAHRGGWEWHASDAEAQRRGIPYALAEGKQNQAIIAHAVTNWMGDDGFVKKLDLQNRGVNYLGDMNWAKGRVARKYIDNGEHLVDLDVWAECQDGRVHTKGLAIVRLLSSEG